MNNDLKHYEVIYNLHSRFCIRDFVYAVATHGHSTSRSSIPICVMQYRRIGYAKDALHKLNTHVPCEWRVELLHWPTELRLFYVKVEILFFFTMAYTVSPKNQRDIIYTQNLRSAAGLVRQVHRPPIGSDNSPVRRASPPPPSSPLQLPTSRHGRQWPKQSRGVTL
jgi:hypothetical protein